MSFDAALVSLLREPPSIESTSTEPTLTIHAVEHVDDDRAICLLRAAADSTLQKFGDYIGELESGRPITSYARGTVALRRVPTGFDVLYSSVKLIAGWVSSTEEPMEIVLGSFSVVRLANTFNELKEELAAVRAHDHELNFITGKLSERLAIADTQLTARDVKIAEKDVRIEDQASYIADRESHIVALQAELDKCRLSLEAERLKSSVLREEITTLFKSIADRDKEIVSLREDAQYAVRTGLAPSALTRGVTNRTGSTDHNRSTDRNESSDHGGSSQVNASDRVTNDTPSGQDGIARCFASLAAFDRNTLKKREERDAILNKKAQKPAVDGQM